MADENVVPQVETGDDNARRTLKLRPSNVNPAGTPLVDPMRGETDTSNLDVLDDTQTRKTIKIKPLNPTTPQVNIGGLPKTPGATPLSGTQTRKAVVIKPQAVPGATPLSGTQTRKAVVIAPQAAPGATPLSGTQTRKTVVLKPMAQTPVINPVAPATPATPAAPAEPAVPQVPGTAPANEMDDTVTRKATVIATPPADDDQTVKISRPKLSKPAAVDPKRTVKLGTVNAPKQVTPAAVPPAPVKPVSMPETDAAKEEEAPKAEIPQQIEMPAAKEAVPPPAVEPVKAPKAEEEEIKEEETAKAADDDVAVAPLDNDITDLPTIELEESDSGKPGLLYTILSAVAVILLLGAVAFTTAQYLDFNCDVDIYKYIPGLPSAGK